MRGLQKTQLSGWFLAVALLCLPNANMQAHGKSIKDSAASQPSYLGAYLVKLNGKAVRKLWIFADRVAETYPKDSVKDALESETQVSTRPYRVAGGLGYFGVPVAFPDAGVTALNTEQLSCSFSRDGSTSNGVCRDDRNRAFKFLIVANRLTMFESPCDGAAKKNCTYIFAVGQPISRRFLEGILNTKK